MTSSNTITVYTESEYEQYLKHHEQHQNNLVSTMLEQDVTSLASNFKTNSIAISLGENSLFGTVNEKEYDNSPMCSPFNLFFLYPKERLKTMQIKWLRKTLNVLSTIFGNAFKSTKFNKVIQVNNKPCDAIAYPQLSFGDVQSCIQKLTTQFPNHAIIFPRIDPITSPTLFNSLSANGFQMIATRPVHLFHPESKYMKRGHTKRDLALLRKSQYSFVPHEEIDANDILRIHRLYQKLFVEKHGISSPDLTLRFFQDSHAYNWYHYFGLRNSEGEIDGFFSYEIEGNVMACGPLGYDIELPSELGLYRMLFAQSLKIARENDYLFNFGGGNEQFKMNRGSLREIGYTAVYCKHLPLYRRIPWYFLTEVGGRIALKIFEKSLI